MNKKRAQITVFIIIGVIVLLAVGSIFLIQGVVREKGLIEEEEPKLKKLPEQLLPVRNYVDTCIREIAVEGLTALGEHGGYINIRDPDNGVTIRTNQGNPTSSDAVAFFPGSDFIIPYWGYLTSPNEDRNVCSFGSKRPPLRKGSSTRFVPSSASIESQLERYMDENLKSCTAGFYSLEREGLDITDSDVTAEVTVAENEVLFYVTHPLEVSTAGSKTTVETFLVKIPLELKRVYELSTALANWQLNFSYLETHVLSLISVYSGLESDDLPPFGETGWDFGGGKMWAKVKVKQDVISMLTSWIRGMQVFGTSNFLFVNPEPDSPYAESLNRIYDNMIIPIPGYDDFSVSFDYLGWPIYFDVPSSKGELIKSESMSNNLLSVVGYQQYDTLYDISFPVYVELKTSPTIDFPDGYRLSFFLEGNIRYTEPFMCGEVLVETPPIATGNLVCNENQRLSGDVNVKVIDAYAPDPTIEKPIPNVLISYALENNNCVYSKTNETGQLKIKIPTALGGAISAMKNGYQTNSEAIELDIDESSDIVIKLYKIKKMNISIKRVTYPDAQGPLLPGANPTAVKLDDDEDVTLILTKIKETPLEGSVNPVGKYSNDEPLQLELVPGMYDVEGMVMLDRRVIIPEQRRESDGEEFTMPKVDLPPPHMWGGLSLSGFYIKPRKLYEYDELQFTVLSFPTPTMIDHMQWLGEIESQSDALNRTTLKPKFRRRIVR